MKKRVENACFRSADLSNKIVPFLLFSKLPHSHVSLWSQHPFFKTCPLPICGKLFLKKSEMLATNLCFLKKKTSQETGTIRNDHNNKMRRSFSAAVLQSQRGRLAPSFSSITALTSTSAEAAKGAIGWSAGTTEITTIIAALQDQKCPMATSSSSSSSSSSSRNAPNDQRIREEKKQKTTDFRRHSRGREEQNDLNKRSASAHHRNDHHHSNSSAINRVNHGDTRNNTNSSGISSNHRNNSSRGEYKRDKFASSSSTVGNNKTPSAPSRQRLPTSASSSAPQPSSSSSSHQKGMTSQPRASHPSSSNLGAADVPLSFSAPPSPPPRRLLSTETIIALFDAVTAMDGAQLKNYTFQTAPSSIVEGLKEMRKEEEGKGIEEMEEARGHEPSTAMAKAVKINETEHDNDAHHSLNHNSKHVNIDNGDSITSSTTAAALTEEQALLQSLGLLPTAAPVEVATEVSGGKKGEKASNTSTSLQRHQRADELVRNEEEDEEEDIFLTIEKEKKAAVARPNIGAIHENGQGQSIPATMMINDDQKRDHNMKKMTTTVNAKRTMASHSAISRNAAAQTHLDLVSIMSVLWGGAEEEGGGGLSSSSSLQSSPSSPPHTDEFIHLLCRAGRWECAAALLKAKAVEEAKEKVNEKEKNLQSSPPTSSFFAGALRQLSHPDIAALISPAEELMRIANAFTEGMTWEKQQKQEEEAEQLTTEHDKQESIAASTTEKQQQGDEKKEDSSPTDPSSPPSPSPSATDTAVPVVDPHLDLVERDDMEAMLLILKRNEQRAAAAAAEAAEQQKKRKKEMAKEEEGRKTKDGKQQQKDSEDKEAAVKRKLRRILDRDAYNLISADAQEAMAMAIVVRSLSLEQLIAIGEGLFISNNNAKNTTHPHSVDDDSDVASSLFGSDAAKAQALFVEIAARGKIKTLLKLSALWLSRKETAGTSPPPLASRFSPPSVVPTSRFSTQHSIFIDFCQLENALQLERDKAAYGPGHAVAFRALCTRQGSPVHERKEENAGTLSPSSASASLSTADQQKQQAVITRYTLPFHNLLTLQEALLRLLVLRGGGSVLAAYCGKGGGEPNAAADSNEDGFARIILEGLEKAMESFNQKQSSRHRNNKKAEEESSVNDDDDDQLFSAEPTTLEVVAASHHLNRCGFDPFLGHKREGHGGNSVFELDEEAMILTPPPSSLTFSPFQTANSLRLKHQGRDMELVFHRIITDLNVIAGYMGKNHASGTDGNSNNNKTTRGLVNDRQEEQQQQSTTAMQTAAVSNIDEDMDEVIEKSHYHNSSSSHLHQQNKETERLAVKETTTSSRRHAISSDALMLIPNRPPSGLALAVLMPVIANSSGGGGGHAGRSGNASNQNSRFDDEEDYYDEEISRNASENGSHRNLKPLTTVWGALAALSTVLMGTPPPSIALTTRRLIHRFETVLEQKAPENTRRAYEPLLRTLIIKGFSRHLPRGTLGSVDYTAALSIRDNNNNAVAEREHNDDEDVSGTNQTQNSSLLSSSSSLLPLLLPSREKAHLVAEFDLPTPNNGSNNAINSSTRITNIAGYDPWLQCYLPEHSVFASPTSSSFSSFDQQNVASAGSSSSSPLSRTATATNPFLTQKSNLETIFIALGKLVSLSLGAAQYNSHFHQPQGQEAQRQRQGRGGIFEADVVSSLSSMSGRASTAAAAEAFAHLVTEAALIAEQQHKEKKSKQHHNSDDRWWWTYGSSRSRKQKGGEVAEEAYLRRHSDSQAPSFSRRSSSASGFATTTHRVHHHDQSRNDHQALFGSVSAVMERVSEAFVAVLEYTAMANTNDLNPHANVSQSAFMQSQRGREHSETQKSEQTHALLLPAFCGNHHSSQNRRKDGIPFKSLPSPPLHLLYSRGSGISSYALFQQARYESESTLVPPEIAPDVAVEVTKERRGSEIGGTKNGINITPTTEKNSKGYDEAVTTEEEAKEQEVIVMRREVKSLPSAVVAAYRQQRTGLDLPNVLTNLMNSLEEGVGRALIVFKTALEIVSLGKVVAAFTESFNDNQNKRNQFYRWSRRSHEERSISSSPAPLLLPPSLLRAVIGHHLFIDPVSLVTLDDSLSDMMMISRGGWPTTTGDDDDGDWDANDTNKSSSHNSIMQQSPFDRLHGALLDVILTPLTEPNRHTLLLKLVDAASPSTSSSSLPVTTNRRNENSNTHHPGHNNNQHHLLLDTILSTLTFASLLENIVRIPNQSKEYLRAIAGPTEEQRKMVKRIQQQDVTTTSDEGKRSPASSSSEQTRLPSSISILVNYYKENSRERSRRRSSGEPLAAAVNNNDDDSVLTNTTIMESAIDNGATTTEEDSSATSELLPPIRLNRYRIHRRAWPSQEAVVDCIAYFAASSSPSSLSDSRSTSSLMKRSHHDNDDYPISLEALRYLAFATASASSSSQLSLLRTMGRLHNKQRKAHYAVLRSRQLIGNDARREERDENYEDVENRKKNNAGTVINNNGEGKRLSLLGNNTLVDDDVCQDDQFDDNEEDAFAKSLDNDHDGESGNDNRSPIFTRAIPDRIGISSTTRIEGGQEGHAMQSNDGSEDNNRKSNTHFSAARGDSHTIISAVGNSHSITVHTLVEVTEDIKARRTQIITTTTETRRRVVSRASNSEESGLENNDRKNTNDEDQNIISPSSASSSPPPPTPPLQLLERDLAVCNTELRMRIAQLEADIREESVEINQSFEQIAQQHQKKKEENQQTTNDGGSAQHQHTAQGDLASTSARAFSYARQQARHDRITANTFAVHALRERIKGTSQLILQLERCNAITATNQYSREDANPSSPSSQPSSSSSIALLRSFNALYVKPSSSLSSHIERYLNHIIDCCENDERLESGSVAMRDTSTTPAVTANPMTNLLLLLLPSSTPPSPHTLQIALEAAASIGAWELCLFYLLRFGGDSCCCSHAPNNNVGGVNSDATTAGSSASSFSASQQSSGYHQPPTPAFVQSLSVAVAGLVKFDANQRFTASSSIPIPSASAAFVTAIGETLRLELALYDELFTVRVKASERAQQAFAKQMMVMHGEENGSVKSGEVGGATTTSRRTLRSKNKNKKKAKLKHFEHTAMMVAKPRLEKLLMLDWLASPTAVNANEEEVKTIETEKARLSVVKHAEETIFGKALRFASFSSSSSTSAVSSSSSSHQKRYEIAIEMFLSSAVSQRDHENQQQEEGIQYLCNLFRGRATPTIPSPATTNASGGENHVVDISRGANMGGGADNDNTASPSTTPPIVATTAVTNYSGKQLLNYVDALLALNHSTHPPSSPQATVQPFQPADKAALVATVASLKIAVGVGLTIHNTFVDSKSKDNEREQWKRNEEGCTGKQKVGQPLSIVVASDTDDGRNSLPTATTAAVGTRLVQNGLRALVRSSNVLGNHFVVPATPKKSSINDSNDNSRLFSSAEALVVFKAFLQHYSLKPFTIAYGGTSAWVNSYLASSSVSSSPSPSSSSISLSASSFSSRRQQQQQILIGCDRDSEGDENAVMTSTTPTAMITTIKPNEESVDAMRRLYEERGPILLPHHQHHHNTSTPTSDKNNKMKKMGGVVLPPPTKTSASSAADQRNVYVRCTAVPIMEHAHALNTSYSTTTSSSSAVNDHAADPTSSSIFPLAFGMRERKIEKEDGSGVSTFSTPPPLFLDYHLVPPRFYSTLHCSTISSNAMLRLTHLEASHVFETALRASIDFEVRRRDAAVRAREERLRREVATASSSATVSAANAKDDGVIAGIESSSSSSLNGGDAVNRKEKSEIPSTTPPTTTTAAASKTREEYERYHQQKRDDRLFFSTQTQLQHAIGSYFVGVNSKLRGTIFEEKAKRHQTMTSSAGNEKKDEKEETQNDNNNLLAHQKRTVEHHRSFNQRQQQQQPNRSPAPRPPARNNSDYRRRRQ